MDTSRDSTTEHSERDGYAAAVRFAAAHGLQHKHGGRGLAHEWPYYPFGVGSFRRVRNVVRGSLHGRSITAFEYRYFLVSDSVEDNGYQRDAAHRFLVAVVDLDHPVPALAAVRTDWFAWHDDELPGPIIDIDHERWSRMFTLIGEDENFGRAVVTNSNAARCAEADLHSEWRFANDELLLWVNRGRLDEHLLAILDVAKPLIEAAETYTPRQSRDARASKGAAMTHTYSRNSDAVARLSAEQRHVTQDGGTEPAYRNEYWDNKEPGIYVDVVSGEPLFASTSKYDSHTGWPSFTTPLEPGNVTERVDSSHGMTRTEVRSAHGDSHLGHVFTDGPGSAGGLRYCMNSAALRFVPVADLEAEGYGAYLHLFDQIEAQA